MRRGTDRRILWARSRWANGFCRLGTGLGNQRQADAQDHYFLFRTHFASPFREKRIGQGNSDCYFAFVLCDSKPIKGKSYVVCRTDLLKGFTYILPNGKRYLSGCAIKE